MVPKSWTYFPSLPHFHTSCPRTERQKGVALLPCRAMSFLLASTVAGRETAAGCRFFWGLSKSGVSLFQGTPFCFWFQRETTREPTNFGCPLKIPHTLVTRVPVGGLAWGRLKRSPWRSWRARLRARPECFEVYGFDFMIAEDLKPWRRGRNGPRAIWRARVGAGGGGVVCGGGAG